jgi:uncharacterized protein YjiS (DUF1127 family)
MAPRRAIDRQWDGLSPAAGWLAWLGEAMRTIATRHHLAQMDERMLKDIGISRSEALEEARRAPWDLGPRGV